MARGADERGDAERVITDVRPHVPERRPFDPAPRVDGPVDEGVVGPFGHLLLPIRRRGLVEVQPATFEWSTLNAYPTRIRRPSNRFGRRAP